MRRMFGYAFSAALALMLVVGLASDRVLSQVGPGSPFTLLSTPFNGMNAATSSISGFGLTNSAREMGTCGAVATVTTSGTDTANAANTDAYVAEVPYNVVTTGVALFNGSTQNGNVTIFLADSLGHQVLATASTATSGATVYQRIPWTAGAVTIQGPGAYYLVFQNSATSNSWRNWPVGNCGTTLLTSGTYGTFPTFTPPTTFTTVQGPIGSLY